MASKKRDETSEEALRLSTIIEQNNIRPTLANAVMAAHGLKSSDRMEPGRLLRLVEEWCSAPAGGK